ncbi:MAG: hypothetical protein EBR82_01305 [Caulobacteraceae bacterium]|nr:hypothetical protein [Caulobacteraceae bacterium]
MMIIVGLVLGVLGSVAGGTQAVVDDPRPVCAVIDGSAECPFPQPRTIDEAFLYLQSALAAVREAALAEPELDASSATIIQAQVNQLQDMFATGSGPINPAYLEALHDVATSVADAANEADAEKANETLVLVRQDLDIKLASSRAALGAGQGRPNTIKVRIKPVRGRQVLSGYEVKCFKTLRQSTVGADCFLTNPDTTVEIMPGVYWVQISRNGSVVYRDRIPIGRSQNDPTEITVPLPS